MMIKCHVWTFSIVTSFWTLSVYQILILNVESFNLKCPVQAHWKLRAEANCTNTMKYYCLFNYIKEKYVEGCNGPDWDRTGSKRIYAGSFTRGDCTQERYQPFKFWTNGSMSDCVYAKSICSEDGQTLYIDNSAKDDRTCRCDYKRNYSFVKIPRQLCYCIPGEEDCSCYIKSCPANFSLSADYTCISNDSSHEKLRCKDTIRYPKADEEKTVDIGAIDIYSEPRWNDTSETLTLFALCIISILVTGAFILAVLFLGCASNELHGINHTGFPIAPKWLREKIQSLKRYFTRVHTGSCETNIVSYTDVTVVTRTENLITDDMVDGNNHESSADRTHGNGSLKAGIERVDVHQPSISVELTKEEVHYLRIFHLLFRVACPVVRMKFNLEIQPDQLRKTLDKKKATIEKKYRKKEKIINNFQWNLLYGPTTGKTVTSDGFDIRLMIYLLGSLANIEVGDLYPVKSDERVSAMLSRIKYIRNEATQSYAGKLSEDQFNKYWDDIAQAVLKLVSSKDIRLDQEKNQFISRLQTLNPIDIDNDKVCVYISLSEKYPADILKQIIIEYCETNGQILEDILKKEKHELYHKRIITESCCVCSDKKFCTYIKVIQEKQWETLYEMKEGADSHSCLCSVKKCSERFVPKTVDTSDLSVTVALVLFIPDILTYIIDRLYRNKFDTFLMNNKHILYHFMETKKCCKCAKDSTEKSIINTKEWNKLFKKEDNVSCKTSSEDCCCHYSVINEIKSSHIDETLLSKIFHVAGPISVLNKIVQDAFLYFLNWTADEKPLRGAITELLNVITDDTFRIDMLQQLSSCNLSQLDENTKNNDAPGWVSKQLRNQQAFTEKALRIQVFIKDALNVKSVQVSKEYSSPYRIRHFKDLTDEEKNFLVVVHGLTKIVYPVIKDEFNTKCTNGVLEEIHMEIFEQQQTPPRKNSHSGKNEMKKKKIYLTQKQKDQLFSPKKEESRNLDLKLMIYILKRKTEEEGKTDYVEQLDVIDDIRREIVLSSSGVLSTSRFQEILQLIRKAVEHFGEEVHREQILNIQNIKTIKELL